LASWPRVVEKVHFLHELVQSSVQGLFHPKMKILSVFTHPHVVPNLYVFICSAEHKGRYLEECLLLIKQISFPIDFHSRKKYIQYYGSQWGMRSVN